MVNLQACGMPSWRAWFILKQKSIPMGPSEIDWDCITSDTSHFARPSVSLAKSAQLRDWNQWLRWFYSHRPYQKFITYELMYGNFFSMQVVRCKKGKCGLHCVKTLQAVLVVVFEEPIQHPQVASVVEGLGDYLISMSYWGKIHILLISLRKQNG